MNPLSMYLLIVSYLKQLPGAMKEHENLDGTVTRSCIYPPHSLRSTTATQPLDAGVHIRKVHELLGHRHITATTRYARVAINLIRQIESPLEALKIELVPPA